MCAVSFSAKNVRQAHFPKGLETFDQKLKRRLMEYNECATHSTFVAYHSDRLCFKQIVIRNEEKTAISNECNRWQAIINKMRTITEWREEKNVRTITKHSCKLQ